MAIGLYLLLGVFGIVAAIYVGSGLVKAPKATVQIIPALLLSVFFGAISLGVLLVCLLLWLTFVAAPVLIAASIAAVIGFSTFVVTRLLGLVLWAILRKRSAYENCRNVSISVNRAAWKTVKQVYRFVGKLSDLGEWIFDKIEPLVEKTVVKAFSWLGNTTSTVGKASLPAYKKVWPGWKDDERVV